MVTNRTKNEVKKTVRRQPCKHASHELDLYTDVIYVCMRRRYVGNVRWKTQGKKKVIKLLFLCNESLFLSTSASYFEGMKNKKKEFNKCKK